MIVSVSPLSPLSPFSHIISFKALSLAVSLSTFLDPRHVCMLGSEEMSWQCGEGGMKDVFPPPFFSATSLIFSSSPLLPFPFASFFLRIPWGVKGSLACRAWICEGVTRARVPSGSDGVLGRMWLGHHVHIAHYYIRGPGASRKHVPSYVGAVASRCLSRHSPPPSLSGWRDCLQTICWRSGQPFAYSLALIL